MERRAVASVAPSRQTWWALYRLCKDDHESVERQAFHECQSQNQRGLNAGTLGVLKIRRTHVALWFAKSSAGTKNRVDLGRVGPNSIIAFIRHEDSEEHEPECAWSAHI